MSKYKNSNNSKGISESSNNFVGFSGTHGKLNLQGIDTNNQCNRYLINFSSLLGEIITGIEVNDNQIWFCTASDDVFVMLHEQECCEDVYLQDIVGALSDLLNTPLLLAEEVTNSGIAEDDCYSCTWTFYKLGTIKGYVDLKWYGSSNGYYSESVSLFILERKTHGSRPL